MNNQSKGITKVTIEFPNGNKETFETVGVLGAFIMNQNSLGAKLGAFATGKFNPATIMGIATGVIEAVAMEMMNQGMPPQGVEEVLSQLVPQAVKSATVREIDARMEQLENAGDPFLEAISQLLKMAGR